jgi:hypothetical protein
VDESLTVPAQDFAVLDLEHALVEVQHLAV